MRRLQQIFIGKMQGLIRFIFETYLCLIRCLLYIQAEANSRRNVLFVPISFPRCSQRLLRLTSIVRDQCVTDVGTNNPFRIFGELTIMQELCGIFFSYYEIFQMVIQKRPQTVARCCLTGCCFLVRRRLSCKLCESWHVGTNHLPRMCQFISASIAHFPACSNVLLYEGEDFFRN